jgi:hypothetical protein
MTFLCRGVLSGGVEKIVGFPHFELLAISLSS